MKFSNGMWLTKKGVTILNPYEVFKTEKDNNSITVYAPCRHIGARSDTVDAPVITYNISSPIKDVICVKMWHNKGAVRKGPQFEINKQKNNVGITENSSEISLKSGDLKAAINKSGLWSMNFSNSSGPLTESSFKFSGHVTDENGNTFMKEQLKLSVGECVYGLGERFTQFVKNGQTIDMWNRDGGTATDQAYKNIPFYITNRGYGVLVNDPGRVSFEVASEFVSRVQFSVPGEYIEYYIINGPTMKNVLENYASLTGKPALPPAWSFGLWLTTSFTTDYDEKTVTRIINGMKQRDIPLHVFHFDCFWMKEFSWCNFEWNNKIFPDPPSMLKRLKSTGLKICVWINPYISQLSKLFDEAMEKGYLLKKADGSVWQWDRWQAGLGIVDFTNPEACKWYKSKLRALLDMGVDCFKTDFGERIPTDVVYYDGSDPVKMHNYYTYLYNKTVYEVLEEKFGKENAVLFARSATTGSQKFPVHWGGDCSANYESMAETLRGGLSLCLSGFGFWSHDISGFENTATPDIYKRWTAFGLLSSHSRLHGNSSYRVPWLFDDEAVNVLRFFTKLKCSLMPYIYSCAHEASEHGIPVMRAMIMEFQDDPACRYLDMQYMFGGSLLVAPVFNDKGTVSYYLPEGTWTNYFTGEKVEGGIYRHEKHGYMSLPLMVRENSIIASGKENTKPDYDYADGVTYNVYELKDTASAKIYGIHGNNYIEFTAHKDGNTITASAKGASKPWSMMLVNVFNVKSVKNSKFEVQKKGTKIVPDTPKCEVIIDLI